MPHSEIIERRLRFLMFDDDTVRTMKQVENLFGSSIDDILDKLYDHVLAQPELKSLFPDKETIERARNAQKLHWQKILFSENFGEAQFEQTKQVGQTHLKVKLEVSWYMSAYCFMLNEFIELIYKQYSGDAKKFISIVRALNKAVALDKSFVIEAYFDAKNSTMKEVLRRATHFTGDVKHLAGDLTQTSHNLSAQAESLTTDSDKSERERNKPPEDQTNISELLKYTDKLSAQVDQLNSRLDKLQFDDKLYLNERRTISIFTRLKNLIVGR